MPKQTAPHVLENVAAWLENVAAWNYAQAARPQFEDRREYHEALGDALMWQAHCLRRDGEFDVAA